MSEKIAFSVPGAGGNPIPIETAAGIPTGSGNLNIGIQWGLTLLFVAAAVVALFFIIWGGIMWITSGGEKEKIQEARNRIIYALIGLVIIFSSYLIVRTVGGLFGGVDPFNLSGSTKQVPCSSNNPHGYCPDGKDCILYNGSYSCHYQ
jgi:hypothetical protein